MNRLVTALALVGLVAGLALAEDADYNRKAWRHWIKSDAHPCRTTRTEALARDAREVEWTNAKECTVKRGHWLDPYTGSEFTDPRKLDVDHMVPLQNAHASGGAKWSRERKQEYANYLGFKRHLVAVSASANRQKGAKAPDAWVPENEAFHCDYGLAWAAVKFVWNLDATETERDAVTKLIETCK